MYCMCFVSACICWVDPTLAPKLLDLIVKIKLAQNLAGTIEAREGNLKIYSLFGLSSTPAPPPDTTSQKSVQHKKCCNRFRDSNWDWATIEKRRVYLKRYTASTGWLIVSNCLPEYACDALFSGTVSLS